jgi:hypothetical protein
MLVIVCHSWPDTRCWWQTMKSIVCQVTSERLWQTSCVKSRVTDYYQPLGVKPRVTEYYQHLVSSDEWQTMTNIVCQVTSDRLSNMECQVTSDSLLPTSGVMSQEKDYDQHWVSSHKWQTMTNIECQVTSGWSYSVTHDMTPDVGIKLSLVTWHQMLVVFSHSWLDTQCWS